jgi:hypothetical protein
MWTVLSAEALIGVGLVAVGFAYHLYWGRMNVVICGAIAVAIAALIGATRVRELRWLTFLLAGWLMASMMMLDALGPLVIASGAAAVALALLVAPLGIVIRPAPARAPAVPRRAPVPKPRAEPGEPRGLAPSPA